MTRYLYGSYVVSSSVCSPAIRTVRLTSHVNEEYFTEAWREIIPVLAIESRLVESYSKTAKFEKEYSLGSTSREELINAGYTLYSRSVEVNAVLISAEYFELAAGHDGETGENGDSILVACTWPESDDKLKFEPMFLKLEGDIRDRISSRAQKLKAQSSAI